MLSQNFILFLVLLLFSVFSARAARAQYFAFTGVHTGVVQSGARPARRNILDMQNDTPTWSLYIQALTAMQNMDANDELSYFQVAGIHGRPYITWNNASAVGDSSWGGYCTHGSVLFLTWHRPYLALIEQLLASHMQVIAQSYNLSIYQTAANNFRLPYWDWASVADMPDVISQQYIQITTASGVETVSNPLYQYNFPPDLNPSYFPASDGPITQDSYTVRDITSLVNSRLQNNDPMSAAYRALTKETSFDGFCTSAAAGLAIENIHDNIHVDIGGNVGHMSYLAYSAFDPIFWLHHANIDRLFAMWQAIYPNQYLTQMVEGTGTYSLPPGTLDTQYTSLEPFTSNGRGQFYTSASSWRTSTFGYTYPEIQDWDQTPAQLKANVTATIAKMYNSQPAFKRAAGPAAQTKAWSVALNVSRYDLQGERFVIRVFLGQVPQNPEDWSISNTLAGSFSILPPPHQGNGPYPTILAYSEISLTKGLMENGVDPTDVAAVEKWLESNLQWGVQKFDMTVVPNEQIPSLYVVVQDEDVTLPGDVTELPIYGRPTLHPEITQGK